MTRFDGSSVTCPQQSEQQWTASTSSLPVSGSFLVQMQHINVICRRPANSKRGALVSQTRPVTLMDAFNVFLRQKITTLKGEDSERKY